MKSRLIDQSKAAIIAILVVIPLVGVSLWSSSTGKETEELPNTARDEAENNNEDSGKKRTTVVASFYPIYLFTQEVGKERVNLDSLVPRGADPHEWDPTPRDIREISSSDVLIINGAGLETWVEDISKLESDLKIVDTSRGIELLSVSSTDKLHHKDVTKIHEEENNGSDADSTNEDKKSNTIEQKHTYDPHIWLDPTKAQVQVTNIEEALSKIDPSNSKFYKKNADSFIEKLQSLDDKARKEFAKCEKKKFITFHGAFSYFAAQYGLIELSVIQGESHAEESSPKRIQEIITHAKKLETSTIFSEDNVNPRLAEVVAEELPDGKVMLLDTMGTGDVSLRLPYDGTINGDNGKEAINGGELYIAKMEKNIQNLKEALCN